MKNRVILSVLLMSYSSLSVAKCPNEDMQKSLNYLNRRIPLLQRGIETEQACIQDIESSDRWEAIKVFLAGAGVGSGALVTGGILLEGLAIGPPVLLAGASIFLGGTVNIFAHGIGGGRGAKHAKSIKTDASARRVEGDLPTQSKELYSLVKDYYSFASLQQELYKVDKAFYENPEYKKLEKKNQRKYYGYGFNSAKFYAMEIERHRGRMNFYLAATEQAMDVRNKLSQLCGGEGVDEAGESAHPEKI